MKKDLIYFAHANGFPGSCYRQFYSYLEDAYQIDYIDTIGHNPNYPIQDNWDLLTQEIIADITSRHQEKIIGVGHSLGGILLYSASLSRPELFKAIVMLDSPIFTTLKSFALKLVKKLGLMDKFTLSGRTKNRRRHWASRQEAFDYLSQKKVFQRFAPVCLHDYVAQGLVADAGGFTLKFDPLKEYEIYRTIPDHLPKKHKNTAIPTIIIYGEQSGVFKEKTITAIKRYYGNVILQATMGGHLFPFEYPEAAAKSLINVLQRIE